MNGERTSYKYTPTQAIRPWFLSRHGIHYTSEICILKRIAEITSVLIKIKNTHTVVRGGSWKLFCNFFLFFQVVKLFCNSLFCFFFPSWEKQNHMGVRMKNGRTKTRNLRRQRYDIIILRLQEWMPQENVIRSSGSIKVHLIAEVTIFK